MPETFAIASLAAAFGVAAGPAAGLSAGGTAGADWIGMVHGEAAGWAHYAPDQRVRPLATTRTEVAWVARAGAWRFGPSVAVDLAFAGSAEQHCTGIGGCLYPGAAAGVGAWARVGAVEVWAGIAESAEYDVVWALPRVRVDWTSPGGWRVGGFFSPGRELLSIQVGRSFGAKNADPA